MVKHATNLPEATEPHETHAPASADPSGEPLEQRVRRLEDAVASLQDTRPLEDRIVERVGERFKVEPAVRPAERSEHMIFAERRTAPPPAADPGPREPLMPPAPPPTSTSLLFARHPWLLLDLFRELRAMIRMFFDVRYHVAWSARVTVLILLPLIFTSYYWVPFSSLFIVGTLLDKTVDLILAFLAYKALSREARRYLEIKADHSRLTP